jgi:5-methylcytosine-specific restriction endonuclease McrA
VTACSRCNLQKGNRTPAEARMFPRGGAFVPLPDQLRENGRAFPPGFLHASWRDYLYWDSELDPS